MKFPAGERKKSAKFWPPTLRPHPSGPTFSGFGPTLRGRTNCETTKTHTLAKNGFGPKRSLPQRSGCIRDIPVGAPNLWHWTRGSPVNFFFWVGGGEMEKLRTTLLKSTVQPDGHNAQARKSTHSHVQPEQVSQVWSGAVRSIQRWKRSDLKRNFPTCQILPSRFGGLSAGPPLPSAVPPLPQDRPLRWTAPLPDRRKFRSFFSPTIVFILSSLSSGPFRGILVVFEAPGESNVRVWSSLVVKPRRPRSRRGFTQQPESPNVQI